VPIAPANLLFSNLKRSRVRTEKTTVKIKIIVIASGEFINLGSSNKEKEFVRYKSTVDSDLVKKAIKGINEARESISAMPLIITKINKNTICLFLLLLKVFQTLNISLTTSKFDFGLDIIFSKICFV
tara:strand:- start:311 stop:691 length:381 start_codon:yes stop_codon:yes gene_type:complete